MEKSKSLQREDMNQVLKDEHNLPRYRSEERGFQADRTVYAKAQRNGKDREREN